MPTPDPRPPLHLPPPLPAQVCGNVKVPTPTARYSADAATLRLGEGAFHLHLAEVNAILRI